MNILNNSRKSRQKNSTVELLHGPSIVANDEARNFKKLRIIWDKYAWLRIFTSVAILTFSYHYSFPSRVGGSPLGGDYMNYLKIGFNEDIITNISTPDIGYLPWLPRVLSYFVTHIFGEFTAATIMVTTWIPLLLAALSMSIINLNIFSPWIRSNGLRFFAGLTLGTFPSYDSFGLENFPNYLVGLFYAMILSDKKSLNRPLFLFCIFITPLILITKPLLPLFQETCRLTKKDI